MDLQNDDETTEQAKSLLEQASSSAFQAAGHFFNSLSNPKSPTRARMNGKAKIWSAQQASEYMLQKKSEAEHKEAEKQAKQDKKMLKRIEKAQIKQAKFEESQKKKETRMKQRAEKEELMEKKRQDIGARKLLKTQDKTTKRMIKKSQNRERRTDIAPPATKRHKIADNLSVYAQSEPISPSTCPHNYIPQYRVHLIEPVNSCSSPFTSFPEIRSRRASAHNARSYLRSTITGRASIQPNHC